MTSFRYEAVDTQGRRKKGVLSADTQRRARRELQSSGLTPLSLKAVGERGGVREKSRAPKPAHKDVIAATRQLATLIDASSPVEEALAAVASQMKGGLGEIMLSIRARIIEGWKLSNALADYPKTFSPLYRGIVAAGETSGNLGPVLMRLAEMLEKNRAMANKALSALIYPAAIFVVAILVVGALMNFVVPQIVSQFDRAGTELPLVTRVVIGASDFFRDFGWLLLLLLIASGIGIWQARKREKPRLAMDRAILRLPMLGNLARDLDAARFARTLATLFASGAPLLDSLSAAKRTVTNAHIARRLDATLTHVREGATLSASIRRAEVFPPMMSSMVAAGERSGRLPDLLERTAAQMEEGFETTVTVALRLLEPAVIVILGGVVLTIVLAIMLPILQINTLAL